MLTIENLKDLLSEPILEPNTDLKKAGAALKEADRILKEGGFIVKQDSVLGRLLDIIWRQAESEVNDLI